jgi:hypothetical protein
MKELAAGAVSNDSLLLVTGDRKSPVDFYLPGAEFIGIDSQKKLFTNFAEILPYNSYTRKNIGYLAAIQRGATSIIDTDDDNAPLPGFWKARSQSVSARLVQRNGWVNVYSYFTEAPIWPRGLPLNEVKSLAASPHAALHSTSWCPVQQGLADDNPDVDAVYRLLFPLPFKFDSGSEDVILDAGAWCPFNSQNTSWWPEAFALLYLPAYCSFRMTDIWRSFVAQRILWVNDWRVSFHSPTVYQDRNEHNLMKDFEDEIPGYVNNERLCGALMDANLATGEHNITENLRRCYSIMVKLGVVDSMELPLLDAWVREFERLSSTVS